MTDNDRKAIQQAVDSTLSGLTGDPFLCQRVVAHAQEGENNMKKKTKFSVSLVLAMIAVLGVMAIAVAAGMSGFMNWQGEFVPEEQSNMVQPVPTPTPEMQEEARLSIDELLALGEAAKYEIVHVEENGSGSWNGMYSEIESLEAFYQALEQADYLPVPQMIPEGYAFANGRFLYRCRQGGAYQLLSEEKPFEGVTVSRYGLNEADRMISGYDLTFRDSDADYHYLSIYVSLVGAVDPTDYAVGVNEDQTAQMLSIPGYDSAISVAGERSCHLSLRRVLPESIAYQYYDFAAINEEHSFEEVHVDVSAPLLTPEVLTEIFAE